MNKYKNVLLMFTDDPNRSLEIDNYFSLKIRTAIVRSRNDSFTM